MSDPVQFNGVTIVLFVALSEEFDAIREKFTYVKDHGSGHNVCVEFDIDEPGFRLIAVLSSGMGAQSALEAIEDCLDDLRPTVVICIGISGAISDDLQTGDVCVSNGVFDVTHNLKVEKKRNKEEISFSPRHYDVSASLSASATFLRNHPTLQDLLSVWRQDGLSLAHDLGLETMVLREPDFFVGPISCGPLVASSAAKEKLRGLDRKMLAIDMESGGVFNRLEKKQILGLSIRGISDYADENKSDLEQSTKKHARRLAMLNAVGILKLLFRNPSFMNYLKQTVSKDIMLPGLEVKAWIDPVSTLQAEIEEHLDCKIFGGRLPSFRLPMPRLREVSYIGEVSARELEKPEDLEDALARYDRIVVRLPRSFPAQTLSWSIAHALLRQTIGNKVLLPIVINGADIKPPRHGLTTFVPEEIKDADHSAFERIYVVEEPPFHDKHRSRFILDQLLQSGAKCIVITRIEESDASIELFLTEGKFREFDLSPISFSETAAYLERAFEMNADEAENVAIRLDETFRKFSLNVHPTYFAGLQEDTISALIHANKRAELIQLAVDGLLSLIVAADKSVPRLARTTRQKFLEKYVLEKRAGSRKMGETELSALATDFIRENAFPTQARHFLQPFYDSGLIYVIGDESFVSHPYLESYLLAEALRADPKLAISYFDPINSKFDYYTYDIYCERGPSPEVVRQVLDYCDSALSSGPALTDKTNVFFEERIRLRSLVGQKRISTFSRRMIEAADTLNDERNSDVRRKEKQRILDARSHAKTTVQQSREGANSLMNPEIVAEHNRLDTLSRAYSLACITIGSGAETLTVTLKNEVGAAVLCLAESFADGWTRNRLRIRFESNREDVLKDESIWSFIDENDLEKSDFEMIKADLDMFLQGFETNMLSEPAGRVLWQLSNSAGFGILEPVIKDLKTKTSFQKIVRATWWLDANAARGRNAFKTAISEYSGEGILRLVLANHLLWRVYWHHYRTASAQRFIDSAKRALGPLGLKPQEKRIEEVKRGPQG